VVVFVCYTINWWGSGFQGGGGFSPEQNLKTQTLHRLLPKQGSETTFPSTLHHSSGYCLT